MQRDRLLIATPEGLTLELALAGVGSRGVATMLDFFIIGLASMLLNVFDVPSLLGSLGAALGILVSAALFAGYFLLFELFNNGQTPGKRIMRIRVMRADGGPLRFVPAMIRSLLRYVDFLPWAYGIGIASVFSSQKNQRLGDVAAGTIVIQELKTRSAATAPQLREGVALPQHLATWDATAISADEMVAIGHFLARRAELPLEARNRLSRRLAERTRDRVTGAASTDTDENFLASLWAVKNVRL